LRSLCELPVLEVPSRPAVAERPAHVGAVPARGCRSRHERRSPAREDAAAAVGISATSEQKLNHFSVTALSCDQQGWSPRPIGYVHALGPVIPDPQLKTLPLLCSPTAVNLTLTIRTSLLYAGALAQLPGVE